VISVVDDDASVREATKSLLRSLGYRATVFSSAEEFLRSEDAKHAVCLITDVQMPGLSGLELYERLVDAGRSIPVIFITAFPEEKIRRWALARGACGFLKKPFDEQSLIGCIDRALAEPA